jgi:hypothetical protein
MPTPGYVNDLKKVSGALSSNSRLNLVLKELLAMVDAQEIHFKSTPGSANTVALYDKAAKTLWGALVPYKDGDLPSFVHELTHARCVLCYQADTVNYAPRKEIDVPEEFMSGAPSGAPPNTVSLTPDCQVKRRKAWEVPKNKTLLDTNLNNLRAWVEVTDFSSDDPFMSAQNKKAIKTATKQMNKGNMEAMKKSWQLNKDAEFRGQVQQSKTWRGSGDINKGRLDTEKQRKKDFILDRINYGLNGMSGIGNTHNEYDTVVNQMLFQMHAWGFRKEVHPTLTMIELAELTKTATVPVDFLYDQISRLAHDAYKRRKAAAGLGGPPVIVAPMTLINPPK